MALQAQSKLNLSVPARPCAQCTHLLGESGSIPPPPLSPPGNFWNFRRSEINSGAFWDTCLSWQGTCYKLTIVYTCENDCKYSTIINSDRHIIEICSCKSLHYTCCVHAQNHALVSISYPHRSAGQQACGRYHGRSVVASTL